MYFSFKISIKCLNTRNPNLDLFKKEATVDSHKNIEKNK